MNITDRIEKSLTTAQTEIHTWTAKEFERLVFDCKPRVAVFDCDGTLWGGDAGYGFMVWSLEQGLVSRSTSDWIDTRYRAYRAGQVSEEEICGAMVQIYAGLRDQELSAAAAQYFNEIVRPNIFAEMVALVAALRKAGVELWAVSSTNRWVVAEGVRDFGIPMERVLAAEVRVVNGIISSEIVGVPTDGCAAAGGTSPPRRGLRQLRARPGHARTGAMPVPGEPIAGTARSSSQARLGILPAAGCRGHFGSG